MSSAPQILIVDDEANIRLFLEEILSQDGYHITTAASGEAALDNIEAQPFDLALIDLKLPGIDGIDVLKTLRRESAKTVVIVLTAHASLDTAVEALRQGAHDYLFKPCKPAELRESVRQGLSNRQSQSRQQELINQLKQVSTDLESIRSKFVEEQGTTAPPVMPAPSEASQRFLEQDDLVVDLLQHLVTLEGLPLETTPTEFDLLVYLIRAAPRAVSPQELIQEVQGYEAEAWEASNIVRRHIHRLRQKIKDSGRQADIIRTVRGVGYALGEEK